MLMESNGKLAKELQNLAEEKVIEYAQKNTKLIWLNETVAKTNEEINAILRVLIPNPFFELTKKMQISICCHEFRHSATSYFGGYQ